MRVFADSFFFIALLDLADAHHSAVLQYQRAQRPSMVTTRWILAEVANALNEPSLRGRVGNFIDQLQTQRSCKICEASDELFSAGLVLYRSRSDKSWSLTDYISFIVMDREGLRQALTGDRHFAQAGFVPLFAT
jgi:predicted nucleic acid-binding protein